MTIYKTYEHNYTYLITNIQENKHYIGVRSCNGNIEDDLGKSYFSSSLDENFIKDQRAHPENYQYQILETFDTRKEASLMEIDLHKYFDVARNPNFYNKVKAKVNSVGYISTGRKHTDTDRAKMSEQRKGKPFSKEVKRNRSNKVVCKFKHDVHGIRISTTSILVEEFPSLNKGRVQELVRSQTNNYNGWYILPLCKDMTIYTFYYKTGEEFIGTIDELLNKCPDLYWTKIIKLINGKIDNYVGWAMNKEKIPAPRKQSIDERRKKADPTIYHFIHEEFGEFFCTRIDLRLKFLNLKKSDVANIIEHRGKLYKGWKINESFNNGETVDYYKKADPTIYHFIHLVYGERYCTRNELKNEFKNIIDWGLLSIINGRQQSHQGWMIEK
jgi:hypothetical protein